MTARRFLVLHLPRLPTDRIRQREPDLTNLPVATWTTQGHRRLLAGVDAPGTTLQTGQALADAQAMHPDLVLRPADPAADAAFLERLALWMLRFTPLAAVDPPDGLVLDVTGCTDLFGGEAALLTRLSADLNHGGIAARAVIACVADAAAALARAGHHGRIVPSNAAAAAVAGLSLTTLRLPVPCVVSLNRLGLQRVRDLLRQPRAPLSRRFGRTLLDRLDALTGERPRPLSFVRPPAVFMATANFLDPIVTRPVIDRALDDLLDTLCRRLGEAHQGARQVTLRAFRVDRAVQEIMIGTGLPTQAPAPLRRLFVNQLERMEPGLGFERLTLQADATNAMRAVQVIMPTPRTGTASQQEALVHLLDRLAQRLPVWRLSPSESHWPERAVTRVGPFDPVMPVLRQSALSVPVRLLPRPVPLRVRATVPDGPPVQIRLDGVVHPIVWAEGPERIEREWWHDPVDPGGRDYYRTELASGARLWIGRGAARQSGQPGRWFLHGYLA